MNLQDELDYPENYQPYQPYQYYQKPRKSTALAIILQSLPLLGAVSCTAEGVTNQNGSGFWVLWFAILFWGLGYLYLRYWNRFALTFVVGPIFALTSCTASLSGSRFDYEHGGTNDPNILANTNFDCFQEAILIAAAVLLLVVDVWRLSQLSQPETKKNCNYSGVIPNEARLCEESLNSKVRDSSHARSDNLG